MTTEADGQLSLLEPPTEWAVKYREWIERNPQVFALYERMAFKQMALGHSFSIASLTEDIRHEKPETWRRDGSGKKLNNNFRRYLALDLKARHPEMAKFLKTRGEAA